MQNQTLFKQKSLGFHFINSNYNYYMQNTFFKYCYIRLLLILHQILYLIFTTDYTTETFFVAYTPLKRCPDSLNPLKYSRAVHSTHISWGINWLHSQIFEGCLLLQTDYTIGIFTDYTIGIFFVACTPLKWCQDSLNPLKYSKVVHSTHISWGINWLHSQIFEGCPLHSHYVRDKLTLLLNIRGLSTPLTFNEK